MINKMKKLTPEQCSWINMKIRCYNKNTWYYKNYGGRGIRVCKRWIKSFDNFLSDMGKRLEGTTLDRIDNDKDYKPSNCRWATISEQNKNRRNGCASRKKPSMPYRSRKLSGEQIFEVIKKYV